MVGTLSQSHVWDWVLPMFVSFGETTFNLLLELLAKFVYAHCNKSLILHTFNRELFT